MFEKIDKVNKLAKALKESSMAKDMDEAVRMAEEMIDKGEESIKDMSEHPSAEELVEGETGLSIKERFKDDIERLEKAFRRKQEAEAKPLGEGAEELLEEAEKERKEKFNEIKKEIYGLKGDIKEAEQSPNSEKIEKIKEEIEKLKKDIEEVEKE